MFDLIFLPVEYHAGMALLNLGFDQVRNKQVSSLLELMLLRAEKSDRNDT
jgi:hypothetical protein